MPELVAQRSHQLSTADGTLLYVSDYLLPLDAERGSIVLMHGLGEHSGRYRRLAQFLNEAGWSVRTYDQRGHGRSQGTRGDSTRGNPLVQDAQIVIEQLSARSQRAPFLLGHSMGGLFAARVALERVVPLRGLVLSSPALALGLSGASQMLLKVMEKLAPHLGLPNALPLRYLTHDARIVAAYKADPLVHGRISARLLRSMLDSIDFCHARAGTLALPLLLLVAGDDHLVDAEGSARFFAALPPSLAQMQRYEGFYHEIFNETDCARPLGDLRAWLTAQDAL